MRQAYLICVCGLISSLSANGQTFSSGSTGADGALDLTSGSRVVQLPESGILNYTTVNVPYPSTLSFKPNSKNTPVIMLAQGAVAVTGAISVIANSRSPGPGGFPGGDPGVAGFGPGGGHPVAGKEAGQWSGSPSLVPIIGGSGGAGGTSGCFGGGGGGALVIASSTSINVPVGNLQAWGYSTGNCTGFGAGSGGAIRLVANSIVVNGWMYAAIVRLEAPANSVEYGGVGTPPMISLINPKITPANPPSVTIVSVGGYSVPSYSPGSLTSIGLFLPAQLPDPIAVVVQANNVPVGSPVSIVFGGSPSATYTPANLAGTTAASTATLYVSGMSRTNPLTYLLVTATFDASLIAGNLKLAGPDAVDRVELASEPGGATRYRFLRKNGSEVALEKVRPELRQALGM